MLRLGFFLLIGLVNAMTLFAQPPKSLLILPQGPDLHDCDFELKLSRNGNGLLGTNLLNVEIINRCSRNLVLDEWDERVYFVIENLRDIKANEGPTKYVGFFSITAPPHSTSAKGVLNLPSGARTRFIVDIRELQLHGSSSDLSPLPRPTFTPWDKLRISLELRPFTDQKLHFVSNTLEGNF